MYKGGFLDTMEAAWRIWRSHRAESRAFAKWLRGGMIDLRAFGPKDAGGLLAIEMRSAVLAGADSVFYRDRRLTGLLIIDTHPDYWEDDGSERLRAAMAAAPPTPASAEEMQYYQRHCCMTRIDKYYTLGDLTFLAGAHYNFFEDHLRILREKLTRPFEFSILNGDGAMKSELRGTHCVIEWDGRNGLGGYSIAYRA